MTSVSLTPMDRRGFHEPHQYGYEDLGSSGSHTNNPSFYRHPRGPTYPAATLDSAVVFPAYQPSVWNTQDAFHRTPGPLSTIPPTAVPQLPIEYSGTPVDFSSTTFRPAPFQSSGLPYPGRIMWTPVQDTTGGPTSRTLVPQEVYVPPRQQRELGGSQTIGFSVRGGNGIRLSDALEGRCTGLEGRDDDSLFGDDRAQIMLRLHVVGCPRWQSKICTTNHTAKRQPIVRAKLAREVAKNVNRFLERERAVGHDDHSRCNWQGVSLSDMYLTRLVRVSAGSWQPEILVVRAPASMTQALPPGWAPHAAM